MAAVNMETCFYNIIGKLTFCCGVCNNSFAINTLWDTSSNQAYENPGAFDGLTVWYADLK